MTDAVWEELWADLEPLYKAFQVDCANGTASIVVFNGMRLALLNKHKITMSQFQEHVDKLAGLGRLTG